MRAVILVFSTVLDSYCNTHRQEHGDHDKLFPINYIKQDRKLLNHQEIALL
jgi:hypothetical protein